MRRRVKKLALYSEAIQSDLAGRTELLSDPSWLVRVGRYLELLTGLGIAAAVRSAGFELLSRSEWDAVATSRELAGVRARLDVAAWQAVWAQRAICPRRSGLAESGPAGLCNLLRKQRVSLAFLEVHHKDLKQAIALAGPDRGGGPQTWRRVFNDAERAVMRTVGRAFPELAGLPACMRKVALWRQCGELGAVGRVPRWLARRFGDQDGLFASASRTYRSSMNAVAGWARARGLMSFAGAECIPPSTSLVETLLRERNHELFAGIAASSALPSEVGVCLPLCSGAI